MFKIGDFSKLSRVSVKTLRFYDEAGLLKPYHVDPFTGYRYYSFEQMPRLNRILALKDLGFSLDQVRQILNDDLTPEHLTGMLRLRQAELSRQIEEAQIRLWRVQARLHQIEEEGKMSETEVIIKSVAPLAIISAREIVPEKAQMRQRCTALVDQVCEVMAQTRMSSSGLCLALYHDSTEQGIDVEMAMALDGAAQPLEVKGVKRYTLRAVPTMASALYQGSYDAFDAVSAIYTALGKWIEANGYRVTGPCRELYVQTPGPTNPNGVMEIQFPVEKASEA